jgi:hypothetical protein
MPVETRRGKASRQSLPSNGSMSLEELLQRFPGLAATIVGCLDHGSKKCLHACSRACRDAVSQTLKGLAVPCYPYDEMIYIRLLQSPRWQHLQTLRMQ